MITKFDNEFFFLSNFFPRPIVFNGETWKSVEHAYQAAKCVNADEKEKIKNADTPGQTKRLGRKVAVRSDWEEIKVKIMLRLLWVKFTQHEDLKEKLLATGDTFLQEGNLWHDNFWGVCNCIDCDELPSKNILGRLLMILRKRLQENCKK